MSEPQDLAWTLSELGDGEEGPQVRRIRDLPTEQVEELRAKFAELEALLGQEDFSGLLASTQRWQQVLAAAESDQANGEPISPRSQEAASREIATLMLSADRLLDALLTTVRDALEPEDLSWQRFEHQCSELRTDTGWTLLRAIADSGESATVLAGGPDRRGICLLDASGPAASDSVVRLLGHLSQLVALGMGLRKQRYDELSAEIKELASEVPGRPGLVAIETDEDGEAIKIHYREFPIYEIAALEQVYRRAEEEDLHAALSETLVYRRQARIRFGDVEVTPAVSEGRGRQGLDDIPEAEIKLDPRLVGSAQVDFWQQVTQESEVAGQREVNFSGVVQRATVEAEKVALHCEGAAELTEHMTGGMVAAAFEPAELLEAMIAQSGFEGELSFSETPRQRPAEDFEVIVPVRGLVIEDPIAIGSVRFISKAIGIERISELAIEVDSGTGADLRAEFQLASSYACTRIHTPKPHVAEDHGLAQIEIALSWLTTRTRYGLATLPSGRPQGFSRQLALLSPEAGPVVLVHGLSSDRQWLRWPEGERVPLERNLEPGSTHLEPQLPTELPLKDRQALLALRLAASQTDPYSQVQAIWQAIESYSAKTKVRRLFSDDQLKAIRDRLPKDLDPIKSDALDRAIAGLNDPPLRTRMTQRLKHDGVPVSDSELALLKRLRDIRNDVVHGRTPHKGPSRKEINQGIGIVARMLVYRVAELDADSGN